MPVVSGWVDIGRGLLGCTAIWGGRSGGPPIYSFSDRGLIAVPSSNQESLIWGQKPALKARTCVNVLPVAQNLQSRRLGSTKGFTRQGGFGSAGVLALGAHGTAALLHIAGLVDHQHRIIVAEMIDHIATQVIRTASASHFARAADAATGPGWRDPCLPGLGETAAVADHRYRARQDHHSRDYDDRIFGQSRR